VVPEVLPFTTSGDIYVQSFDFPFNFPKIGVPFKPLGSKSATLHFWKALIKAYSRLKFDGAAAKKKQLESLCQYRPSTTEIYREHNRLETRCKLFLSAYPHAK